MPKKPNGAGGMQEYVPAGNGDASGEYADGEGSNRHFTAFKKPDGGNTSGYIVDTTNPPKTTPNAEETGVAVKPNDTGRSFKGFDDYIETGFKAGKYLSKEQLRRDFESGSEDARGAVSHFIETGDITYQSSKDSYYQSGSRRVFMNTNDTGNRWDGETFYHESAHAIDWALGEEKEEHPYSWLTTRGKSPMTETKVTANGKTFNETIHAEMQAMKRDGRWDAVVADYREFSRTGVQQKTPEQIAEEEDYNSKYQPIREQAGLYAEKEAGDPWHGGVTWTEYKKRWRRAFDNYMKENTPEDVKALGDKIAAEKAERDKANRRAKSRYDTLSDIYGAAYKASYGFANCGHSANYYRNSPSGSAHEFFAEYFSARATGDTVLIETTKRYMPETAKACEELYQYAVSQGRV